MPHREEQYEANGHSVKILQVNEGGEIHAWIDGMAAYIEEAMDSFTDSKNFELRETNSKASREFVERISKKVAFRLKNGYNWGAVKDTLSYMTDSDLYYCKKCGNFYDYNNSVSTGFSGHKCEDCLEKDSHCADSADGSHEDRCLNPQKKRNARVRTKYQCKHCGRKRETIATG